MIKNIIIGILLIGILSIIGYFIFIQNFQIFDNPVETKIKTECDYDGLRKIVMSEINGNATSHKSIQILATDCNSENRNQEEIFLVSASFINQSDVNFKWKSFDTVTITYNKKLEVFKHKRETDSINPKIIFEYKLE